MYGSGGVGPDRHTPPMSCLFCRRDDGGFTSREHAFPESLGNVELILPPGVVCDRCNNGPLATLDKALCEFGPISLRRTMLGVRSKAGKIPAFRTGNGRVEHVPGADGVDPTLIFSGSQGRSMLREQTRHPDGRVELRWSGAMSGPRMTSRYAAKLHRALLKAALELAWLDHKERAFDADFDHIREAALGAPRDGFLTMASAVDPNEMNSTINYWLNPAGDDSGRILVLMNYAGLQLGTDSRHPRPLGDPAPGPITWRFTESDYA